MFSLVMNIYLLLCLILLIRRIDRQQDQDSDTAGGDIRRNLEEYILRALPTPNDSNEWKVLIASMICTHVRFKEVQQRFQDTALKDGTLVIGDSSGIRVVSEKGRVAMDTSLLIASSSKWV